DDELRRQMSKRIPPVQKKPRRSRTHDEFRRVPHLLKAVGIQKLGNVHFAWRKPDGLIRVLLFPGFTDEVMKSPFADTLDKSDESLRKFIDARMKFPLSTISTWNMRLPIEEHGLPIPCLELTFEHEEYRGMCVVDFPSAWEGHLLADIIIAAFDESNADSAIARLSARFQVGSLFGGGGRKALYGLAQARGIDPQAWMETEWDYTIQRAIRAELPFRPIVSDDPETFTPTLWQFHRSLNRRMPPGSEEVFVPSIDEIDPNPDNTIMVMPLPGSQVVIDLKDWNGKQELRQIWQKTALRQRVVEGRVEYESVPPYEVIDPLPMSDPFAKMQANYIRGLVGKKPIAARAVMERASLWSCPFREEEVYVYLCLRLRAAVEVALLGERSWRAQCAHRAERDYVDESISIQRDNTRRVDSTDAADELAWRIVEFLSSEEDAPELFELDDDELAHATRLRRVLERNTDRTSKMIRYAQTPHGEREPLAEEYGVKIGALGQQFYDFIKSAAKHARLDAPTIRPVLQNLPFGS
ncbi:MAG: hypothetical protein O3A46_02295, partial [Candidatus Poribacteria bacterium]|nr:hypothetical protein [Candidatus Poribacteria bacterium]